MSEPIYGLYRGDEFLDVGTAKELAKRMGVARETIKSYATPSHHKRAEKQKDALVAVRL